MRIVVFISALVISVYTHAATAKIDKDARYTVAGLTKPAEIIVDQWGVPHIYANDHYDAFFVQGFNAARDRLWQIDTWRRRGLGRLSEVLGSAYVNQDRAARLFLYRGDMYSEWLAYGNDAKKITEAFTAGINAFIDLTEKDANLLPPEFTLLGYAPAKWAAEDVVRIRSNGLWRNVTTEVWRARLACQGKLDLAASWKVLEPSWVTEIPDGSDPCAIPDNVLDLYFLAKSPVDFAAAMGGRSNERDAIATTAYQDYRGDMGSNNWVVSGERTATGRPILADDPHRGHAVPSLRYIAHLNAPGINVIGAGEPALPGISIGHNERIAFGLTIFPIDQEDLYIYERRGSGYVYQGRQEPLQTVQETININGEQARTVDLQFTRHGPVVAATKKHFFAVRAAWLEPGMAPYFGSIEYMRAQNFRTFVGALNRWGAPAENQVYADIDGNIGYKPAGRFPKRDNWDGLLPVPGDGSYEWDGYFDMDVLPEEYNPKRGFSGTANAMSLPEDYPIDKFRVGFEWSAPWRYKRLWEVLERQDQHSLQDSTDLQRDYHSIFAREILLGLPELGTEVPQGGALLAGWNAVLDRDSAAAALWNVWYHRHLEPALMRLIDDGIDTQMAPSLDTLTALSLLSTPQGKQQAYATLPKAWAETQQLLGNNPKQWRWGDLHRTEFHHPLLNLVSDDARRTLTMTEHGRGGSSNTTNNTGFRAKDFLVRSGASFRMVVDVGNWDAARMTNAPGQSGDPRSRFYNNLLENWANDEDLPMLFSKQAINANAVFRITLIPSIEQMEKDERS